jgi:hypothetical protein
MATDKKKEIKITATKKKEEFKLSGDAIIEKIKSIVKEGNARKIIIKNENGETIAEFPLAVGAVGALLAPILAAVGAIAGLLTKCTLVVEKK